MGQTPFPLLFAAFLLSCLAGFLLTRRASPDRQQSLWSLCAALSSAVIVGAVIAAGPARLSPAKIMGLVAIGLASAALFGGFFAARRLPEAPPDPAE